MAEEQLNLIDGMSASLRRICQEAERLNKRMLSLKADIKSLEKPMSLSFLRRELKETEKQAKLTQNALKRAVRVGEKEGVLSWNARYRGIQHLMPYGQKQYIKDADLIRYGQRLEYSPIRRNRMLWDNGRIVNGMTFNERLAKLQEKSFSNMFSKSHPILSNMAKLDNQFGLLSNSSSSLVGTFMTVTSTLLFFGGILSSVADAANRVFIQPQSKYMSDFTRVAMTNDGKKTPREMMNELYDTASRTRAPADATFMLYNRVALSGVKATNERIRRFVESFNKVTAISGTTGQENRAVMLQLAQGIGSNRLGGDEFRSISEQAPLFKYMLAKGMGVNPGALKEMGAQGKLTAEAILTSMEKVQDQIDSIFKEAPLTVDQSLNILQNHWSQLVNEQFVGYMAIRDLIRDITIWMTTPKGKEVLSNIIQKWNIFLYKTAQLIREKVAPAFIWVLTHLKLIKNVIIGVMIATLLVRTAIGLLKMAVIGFKFLEWFMSASAGAVLLRTTIQSMIPAIDAVGLAVGKWIPPLLIVAGILFAISKLIPAVNGWVKEDAYITSKLKEKGYSQEDIGKASAYEMQNKGFMAPGQPGVKMTRKSMQAYNDAIKLREQYKKDHPKEGTPEYYEKLNRDAMQQFQKVTENMGGMTDSSKNVPMVGKVKEVGKVNDKISIDNDGIEMMKAIAERQWVMQNEVTVPQNVPITITKEVDVDEERIAEAITGGMKIAVASSMRGATL